MSLNLQGQLSLGAGDSIAWSRRTNNGFYPHKVFLANIDKQGWHEKGLTLDDAIYAANFYESEGYSDCYVSANSFNFKGNRSQANVSELNSFFVDFDYYKKPAYAGLSAIDFADKVLSDNPWLPVPSMLISSGAGCWFVWTFKRPLLTTSASTVDWLSQWQTYQDFINRELLDYGADLASSESARVMRLCGTFNSKNGALAQAWTTADKYEFKDLKERINQRFKDVKKSNVALLPVKNPRKGKVSTEDTSKGYNWHSLANARLRDLERLAWLRGGKITNCRRMMAFVYAAESAHFCRGEESLRSDVTAFVGNYFANPAHYLKNLDYEAVIKRMNMYIARGYERTEKREENPYVFTTDYIIETLNITGQEMRKLKTLIGKDEKYRRKVSARRKAGVKPREQYLAESKSNQEQAVKLKEQGHKAQEIADRLGVSRSSVFRYLKESQVCP